MTGPVDQASQITALIQQSTALDPVAAAALAGQIETLVTIQAAQAAPVAAPQVLPEPGISLDDALAGAYDYFTHAIRGKWSPEQMALQIDADPALLAAAQARAGAIQSLIAARGEQSCFASAQQLKGLEAALALVNA